MFRKLFVCTIAAVLLVTTYIPFNSAMVVEANTGEELKKQMQELQKQRSELEDEASRKKEELSNIENEIKEISSEIQALDEEVAVTSNNIENKKEEINETEESINDLKEEISELEERIAERDELLKSRARHMYKNGGVVSYLEVIFGARSFGDFLERVNAVSQIARQDRNILEQHYEDKIAVEEAKTNLENDLAALQEQKEELEQLKAQLDNQLKEKEKLISKLEDEQLELEDYIFTIEEEEKLAKAQEEAIAQELKRWEEEQRRLEEERRKAEEEARRKAELAQRQKEQQNQQQQTEQPKQTVSKGKLFRPANGSITSGFGMRVHPITGKNKPHNGIDISSNGGTDIYAAASGTVSFAGYMRGFGNTVIITHIIDGQTVHTLYAHLASYNVSNGQQVSRGQRIATMGTTGTSTGVHLHFEVRVGNNYWYYATPRNPMEYL